MKSDDDYDDAQQCAHITVKYDPRIERHPKYGEVRSDAWSCELCGTAFIRKPLVARKSDKDRFLEKCQLVEELYEQLIDYREQVNVKINEMLEYIQANC